MDTNRQRAGKMDWLCCFKGGARYAELEIEASPVFSQMLICSNP